jgi:PAS domain S-box-containing protein
MDPKLSYSKSNGKVKKRAKVDDNQPQLADQLALLSAVVKQSTEGVAVTDLNGKLLYLNDAFATMHGYSSDELNGKNLSMFHTPDQMPSVEKANQTLKETGKFSGEIWHLNKDGTVFPTLMQNSILRDSQGHPVAMIGTLHDISDIKRLEENLRKTHERLEHRVKERTNTLRKTNEKLNRKIKKCRILEHELKQRIKFERMLTDISADSMVITDITKYQNKCLKIMGKALDVCRIFIFEHRYETDTMDNTYEWVAKGIVPQKKNLQKIPSSNLVWLADQMKNNQVANCSDIEEIESKQQRESLRAQGVKAILAVPLFVGHYYYGFMGFDECRQVREWKKRDVDILKASAQIITRAIERNRSEQALQIKNNAVESSMNALAFADLKGNLTYVNKSLLEMWGFHNRDEVIGRPAVEFWQDQKKAIKIIKALRKNGRWLGELVARKKDGSLFEALLSANMVTDEAGQSILIMGSCVDITKRKRVEKALIKRESELLEKSRSLEEANTALRVILKQLTVEKHHMEKRIVSNVKQLIIPHLSKLRNSRLKSSDLSYIRNIETHVNEILSPFTEKLSSRHLNFTPSEIRVASLIKEDKSTKEIAEMLHSSVSVIIFHRHNIRKKLGLINKKSSLRSYFQSL